MNKKVIFAITAVGLSAMSALAIAGAKWTSNVYVSNTATSKWAYGSAGSARNSADANQYIGCYVNAATASAPRVTCSGRDAAGTSVSCSSSAADFLQAANAIHDSAYIYFIADASGNCTTLTVTGNSAYDVKKP